MPTEAGPGHPAPLSPDQFAQLSAARLRSGKIRRAVATARFSGWTTAIFGGLTLIGGIFSLPALLLGLAMIGGAVNELRAASRLRILDPAAPRRLAWNQILLCGALCAYCGWNLFCALAAPIETGGPTLAAGGDIVASAERLTRGISVLVYSCAIILCVLIQTITALYYASRARYLRDYIRATPSWVIDIQRAA